MWALIREIKGTAKRIRGKGRIKRAESRVCKTRTETWVQQRLEEPAKKLKEEWSRRVPDAKKTKLWEGTSTQQQQ